MKTRLKALSPIIATILLVVIAVILISAILSFGKNFTTKGLNQTKDVKDLSKSDAEHFIYPKTFSDGVIQFSYSPPNNFGDINITKYKILYDNNETEEVTLDTAYTLKTGTNLINLKDFSDQNVTSNKFTLILETEDNKYVTLKNITNPYPYVEPEPELQQYFAGPLNPGTMADDATIGTVAWSNVNNAKVSDDNDSTASSGDATTHYLKATNFGFNIPTGATIDGIKIEIEKASAMAFSHVLDSQIRIVKANGSIGNTDRSIASNWPDSDTNTYTIYGDTNDLWGETWTAEQINDVNFGVAISANMIYTDGAGHGGGGAGGNCLHGDTLISTDNSYVKIKDLQVGYNVISYNDTTKQLELKPITDVWSRPISVANNKYFYIYYNNGKIIKATENHRFYINGEYIRADELKIGDKLLSSDLKEQLIENIEIVENTTDMVWDIEVEDNHNFFANDILVHNLSYYAYVDHIRMTVYYTN